MLLSCLPLTPDAQSIVTMQLFCCILQIRHPLALAHFANHPPSGTQPNVMVAAYDFVSQEGMTC